VLLLPRKLQPLSKVFLYFENGVSGFFVNFATIYTATWFLRKPEFLWSAMCAGDAKVQGIDAE
jgi:hypothetical protein